MDQGRNVPSPDEFGYVPPNTADTKANKEQLDLERISRSNEHHRTERLRDTISKAIVSIVYSITAAILIAIFFVAWHNMSPESWRWLKEDDLQNLYRFLFSGAIVSSVTLYLRKHL